MYLEEKNYFRKFVLVLEIRKNLEASSLDSSLLHRLDGSCRRSSTSSARAKFSIILSLRLGYHNQIEANVDAM